MRQQSIQFVFNMKQGAHGRDFIMDLNQRLITSTYRPLFTLQVKYIDKVRLGQVVQIHHVADSPRIPLNESFYHFIFLCNLHLTIACITNLFIST